MMVFLYIFPNLEFKAINNGGSNKGGPLSQVYGTAAYSTNGTKGLYIYGRPNVSYTPGTYTAYVYGTILWIVYTSDGIVFYTGTVNTTTTVTIGSSSSQITLATLGFSRSFNTWNEFAFIVNGTIEIDGYSYSASGTYTY